MIEHMLPLFGRIFEHVKDSMKVLFLVFGVMFEYAITRHNDDREDNKSTSDANERDYYHVVDHSIQIDNLLSVNSKTYPTHKLIASRKASIETVVT